MNSEIQSYLRHELPRDIAIQIRSYIRVQWPFLYADQTHLWNYTPQSRPSRHFVLMDNELLISHASVNWRELTHHNQSWRVYGLSAVFTYPDRRGTGLAPKVVAAATEHIQKSDADLAMLFCGQRLQNFYTRQGWTPVPTARIFYGDPERLKDDNLVMMLFVSARAQKHRQWFEHEECHVGESTW